MSSGNSSSSPRYKVERIIDRYDLEMGEVLERKWLGQDGDDHSLRDLAKELNLAILERSLAEHERVLSEPELETTYRLLRGEDGTRASQTKIRRDLAADGVPIEEIESDFVTHQAVYTYLTEGRGVSKERKSDHNPERSRETINRLVSKTRIVTKSELERLRSAEELTLGEFDTVVSVTVTCSECGTHGTVSELLDAGGCNCSET